MILTLARLRADLEAVSAEAIRLCASLHEDELPWKPGERAWSIAENLIHLRITTTTFLPAVDAAIAETRRRGKLAAGPFHLGLYGRILVRYVEPPPLLRLPAPRRLRPAMGPVAEALPAFLQSQRWMLERMQAADGLDLTALRFGSPLAAYVRMNLLEFFGVFNGHSRRHIWQASHVRRLLRAA